VVERHGPKANEPGTTSQDILAQYGVSTIPHLFSDLLVCNIEQSPHSAKTILQILPPGGSRSRVNRRDASRRALLVGALARSWNSSSKEDILVFQTSPMYFRCR
jgi:hypothetical protein